MAASPLADDPSPSLPSSSSGSILSQITAPTAKLGNEFSSPAVAKDLQQLFSDDLALASRAIVDSPTRPWFSVWAALAWDLANLIVDLKKNTPFTTIATALDIFARSVRYERLQRSSTPPRDEAQLAIDDAEAVRRMTAIERNTWLYASFLLATKVEETLVSFTQMKLVFSKKFPDIHKELIEGLVKREQRILSILGFDIVVHIPHIQLLKLGSKLELSREITQCALRFLNISIFTAVMTTYDPVSIAVTALYHAVLNQSAAGKLLPSDPLLSQQWWDSLQVPMSEIVAISTQMIGAINAFLKPSPPLQEPLQESGSSVTSTSTLVLPPLPHRRIKPCRQISEFEKVKVMNKGTFGTVWQAKEIFSDSIVALKRLHSTFHAHGGFPYYMLREILYLIRLHHKNIIHGSSMAVKNPLDSSEVPVFYIVMEFVEWDLLKLLQHQLDVGQKTGTSQRFSPAQVKSILSQLLQAIEYMHSMNLLHRDLKCANLLLTRDGVIKVADLGSIRDADRTTLNLTVQVITLWYRPPELILEFPKYSSPVDIWSIGCLFFELLTYKPLFPGKSELDTILRIIRGKGAPPPPLMDLYKDLPLLKDPNVRKALQMYPSPRSLARFLPEDVGEEAADLFCRMLDWNPATRITATEALSHPYFFVQPEPALALPPPPPEPVSVGLDSL